MFTGKEIFLSSSDELLIDIVRDEILTELGLPLNFFNPGTEFNGDFPKDLNETYKAVTYDSADFNIEWFFEQGNKWGLELDTWVEQPCILYIRPHLQIAFAHRKQGQQNHADPRSVHIIQWEMRHLVCERGSQSTRILCQNLLGTTWKQNASHIS